MDIQINTLFLLQSISDCYIIRNDLKIYNINSGKEKKQIIGKRGYYYVTLNQKRTNKQIKVYVHKIIALAFIKNSKYEVINHIDGNKLNNNINNLEFCTQKDNIMYAIKHGLINRKEETFSIIYNDNNIITGTIKELCNITNIPKQTIYYLFYKKSNSLKHNIKQIIKV